MSDSSNHSATDIITYIGVPLAVLGVLPILYNTIATLAALSRIKRLLRHSKLTGLTRSDVVNRVIEVELPRYAVRPMDRFSDRAEYWSLSRHPSSIPGGSWTTFNWRTNVIGLKTQRVEYVDQLRQPQVEVAFDELVCYLLDLGAVPDPHGWRLLRSTGLWTPVGCALMLSPDGKDKALTIAPLDGSDGHLSLAVSWSGPWTTRDYSQLPPYWVRLPPPPTPPPSTEEDQPAEEEPNSTLKAESSKDSKPAAERTSSEPLRKDDGSSTLHKPSLDSARDQAASNARHPITCQISADGIMTALSQNASSGRPGSAPHHSSLHLESLYIEHLRLRAARTDGAWFASAATAYGTTSQTILWNYRIPDGVLSFARRESVPCGVLVLLGVVADGDTPEWASEAARGDGDRGRELDRFGQRHRAQMAAMQAEARMAPAQRADAVRERMRKENEERMQDMREKMRQDSERRETRRMEALQSPKWDTKLVAEHNLRWLRERGELGASRPDRNPDTEAEEPATSMTLKEAVGTVLHRMVLDGEFAGRLCRMLDLWRAWAENGGMRRTDLAALQEDQVTFAYATLLVAIIKDTATALEGTVSMDLQECLRMWRTIRLG